MKHNLKRKVTLWYTSLLALLLVAISIGILFLADRHIVEEAKLELQDEITDFYIDLEKREAEADEDLRLSYYDDGVILSIYDEQGKLLHGFQPNEFPLEMPFEAEKVREIQQKEHYWVFLDQQVSLADELFWIRGIYTLDLLEGMESKVLQIWLMIIPVLLFVIGFLGYRMLNRAMNPIYHMTKMADEITKSDDLTLRLPEPQTSDELAYLTQTFNYMLNHLEEMFQREKQFSSDAAHELRTPISVISSHCEYCLEELELDPEVREELLIISRKAHDMSELVNYLLMIARAESGKFKPVYEETDLEIVAETVLDELYERAGEKQIQIQLKNKMISPEVFCDPRLVMVMISNLTDNAIRYGRAGGRVEVSLEQEEESYLICVRDDGPGISCEEQEKIWNRFYRVDPSHSKEKGFGLGLFLVRGIAELHEGSAELQSEPGKGSIFTIRLPIHPEQESEKND